jgi:serine/threonine protein kinase/tetratricopeptide (TPR) repeat protein
MTLERWKRIEKLLHAALAHESEERSAFLYGECGEDEAMLREIESLIAHHCQATSFLETPLPEIAAELFAERPKPLTAGQSVGHYRVIAPLGAGGMGEVYLAVDTQLERRVALKILPDSFAADSVRSLRFEREARAVAALNHPNIVTIHEIGQADNIHFMATEFVDGQTLSQRIANARLTLPEALDVALQTATALDSAHDAGILHRDIKPANIMLRPDGIVKLLDFGLAKLIDNHTGLDFKSPAEVRFRTGFGVILGTPHYMSPEQVRGQDLDTRTDIFSLGVVIFEMITGRLPFDGTTVSDVISAILLCEPPALSRLVPDIPPELEHIVHKALAKDRQERYPTIFQLLSDLRNLKQEMDHQESNRQYQQKPLDLIGRRTVSKPVEFDAIPRSASLPAPDKATLHEARTLSLTLENGQAIPRHYGRVAAISVLSLVVWLAAFGYGKKHLTPKPENAKVQRIAVLPVANLSGDPNQEYFADGLTDDLITTLGRIKALNVISRTTVMRFKGSKTPLPEIARKINVDYLIEASTIRAGNRARINVRLMEASTEQPTWLKSYDREISDILALQDDIARAVAREVSVKLSPEEEDHFIRKEFVNPEVYDACKMGQFHFNKRTVAGYQASIKYFELAIAKDPDCALAYAGLALVYSMGVYSLAAGLNAETAISQARTAAEKAIELDSTQAQAHAALGYIRFRHDFNWAGAEKEFKRSIELNPNYSEGYLSYAQYLAAVGRNDEARARYEEAYALDPMSPNILANYAISLAGKGDFDAAIRMHRRSIELSGPGQWNTYLWMGTTCERMARYTEAIKEIQKAVEISGSSPAALAVLGHAYALAGMRVEAEKILNNLKKSGNEYLLAYLCAGLDRNDEAIRWLEKLYKGNKTGLFLLKSQWVWDRLRSNPRFQALLRQLGLPPDDIKHIPQEQRSTG